MTKDSQALKKLGSPYGTGGIMPNMKNRKKGSFNDEWHFDSKGNTTNNTKYHP